MTREQNEQFNKLARLCMNDGPKTIQVGGKKRREAIVGAYMELQSARELIGKIVSSVDFLTLDFRRLKAWAEEE